LQGDDQTVVLLRQFGYDCNIMIYKVSGNDHFMTLARVSEAFI